MISNRNRTVNYVTTIWPNDLPSIVVLAAIRTAVKTVNADLKWLGLDLRYRVCVNGRLGKNNPNAPKYRRGGTLRPQRIRLEDAGYADVYVARRYNSGR